MANIRKTLIDIENTRSFEQLEPFKSPNIWKSMHEEERALLARLLTLHGSHQLADGDQKALESFEAASEVSSQDPRILMQQGTVLSAYRDNMRCLQIASCTFAKVVEMDPTHSDAWLLQAQVLSDIGEFENEASYFQESHQCYMKASALFARSSEEVPEACFFWKWGVCLASLGKLSGEPLDFHHALEKFHRAYDLGADSADFFLDFGHSFADLAALLEKREYFFEAMTLFDKAVKQDPYSFDGWVHLACCMQCLMEFGYDDELWHQAEVCFMKASELNSESAFLWLKWGQVEYSVGRLKRDLPMLESSLKKFAASFQLDPGNHLPVNNWAEAVLFLGSHEERLDLIREAKTKIETSLGMESDDPHTWYLYGSCYNELGRYFHSEDHYLCAIEKFKYGLSQAPLYSILWYGLALTHFALGELKGDKLHLERAVHCCSKVMECGGSGFAQFWNDWGVALLALAEATNDPSHVRMAIEKFEKALKHPIEEVDLEEVDLEWLYNYGSAFDLLGELTEESGHFEKAAQILQQVIQIDPDYYHARYSLALALANLGEALFDVESYQKACEHFQYLLEQDCEDDMVHLDYGITLINLGLIIQDANHPDPAQVLFKHAEAHLVQAAALGNFQSYYQLAGLCSITGQLGQAMYYLERASFCGVLPGIEDLIHDEWLETLSHTPPFRQFINELSRQPTDEKA
jgi:tetratricopeptide (TPR) repeat protein